MTPDQLALLARLLRLSDETAAAVRAVLLDGQTQQAAGDAAGVHRPHVSRACGLVRRLDAEIRAAYPLTRQAARQRAAARSDDRT